MSSMVFFLIVLFSSQTLILALPTLQSQRSLPEWFMKLQSYSPRLQLTEKEFDDVINSPTPEDCTKFRPCKY